jgi:hypothetical protein
MKVIFFGAWLGFIIQVLDLFLVRGLVFFFGVWIFSEFGKAYIARS